MTNEEVIRYLDGLRSEITDTGSYEYEYLTMAINALSAQKDVSERKDREWDIFELITSAYHGKQYYFKEEYGLVYSRASHKTMTFDDALSEFLREVG